VPYEDKKSLAAVEKLMKEPWDEIIQIGDFMDFDCISSHNKNNLRAIQGKTIFQDYAYANTILDRWQKITRAKITIIEGNHEDRVNRYIDANPQLEGIVEVPVGLRLKERGINWVPFWQDNRKTYTIGKATFIHGNKTTNFHTKAMAQMYGRNIFYGHTHDVQSFSVQTAGDDNTYVGQSLGCLVKYGYGYMRGKPSKWQQAVAAFHFFEDGNFTYEVIRIFKHRFYFNGKTYG